MNIEFYIKYYGKSFYWAGKFLEKEILNDCSTLYAFCRVIDNLADENKNSKSSVDIFIKDYFNKNSKIIVIKKFKQIEQKYKIPKKFINDLFYGIKLDTKAVRIKSIEEIIKYSYYVGGTVGAMMAYIFKTTSSKALKHAIDLGIAMQLTNIARDVMNDAKLGRIYLPTSSFNKKISVYDLSIKNFNPNKLFDIIKKIIAIAEKYYENGNRGIKYLPIKVKFSILLASNLYRGIGNKIIKVNQKDYFKNRIYLNIYEKIIITLKSFYMFKFRNKKLFI